VPRLPSAVQQSKVKRQTSQQLPWQLCSSNTPLRPSARPSGTTMRLCVSPCMVLPPLHTKPHLQSWLHRVLLAQEEQQPMTACSSRQSAPHESVPPPPPQRVAPRTPPCLPPVLAPLCPACPGRAGPGPTPGTSPSCLTAQPHPCAERGRRHSTAQHSTAGQGVSTSHRAWSALHPAVAELPGSAPPLQGAAREHIVGDHSTFTPPFFTDTTSLPTQTRQQPWCSSTCHSKALAGTVHHWVTRVWRTIHSSPASPIGEPGLTTHSGLCSATHCHFVHILTLSSPSIARFYSLELYLWSQLPTDP
jgi:hypothetical protein